MHTHCAHCTLRTAHSPRPGLPLLTASPPSTPAAIVAPPAWIQSYVSILSRRGWLAVALFWLCVTVAGAAGAARTFGNLKLQIEAIPGDANDLAAQALRAHFPEVWRRQLTLVELRASDGTTAVTSSAPVRAAADRLGRFAAPYVASGLISSDSAASFFNLSQAGLAPFAAPLLSPSGTSVAVQFFTTEGYAVTDRYKEFLLALRDELRAAEAASGGAVVGRDTGPLAISFDSSTAITMDIGIRCGCVAASTPREPPRQLLLTSPRASHRTPAAATRSR